MSMFEESTFVFEELKDSVALFKYNNMTYCQAVFADLTWIHIEGAITANDHWTYVYMGGAISGPFGLPDHIQSACLLWRKSENGGLTLLEFLKAMFNE